PHRHPRGAAGVRRRVHPSRRAVGADRRQTGRPGAAARRSAGARCGGALPRGLARHPSLSSVKLALVRSARRQLEHVAIDERRLSAARSAAGVEAGPFADDGRQRTPIPIGATAGQSVQDASAPRTRKARGLPVGRRNPSLGDERSSRMRYHALATDYDGTAATHGVLDDATAAALVRLRATGRKLLLVTGRQIADLQAACPSLGLFDAIVAENGALVYRPTSREVRLLAAPPPSDFVQALRARGVDPISIGQVVVATLTPHENTVLEVIRALGLELQVSFNKGAVMVLPSGVNKATGLHAALSEMGLSPHNVVAIGDAENDHAFLSGCECGVAVANAIGSLKAHADWVTPGAHGAGVTALVDAMLRDDLAELAPRLTRHDVALGRDD